MKRSSWDLDDSAGQGRSKTTHSVGQPLSGDDRRQGTKDPCSSISLVRLKRANWFVEVICLFVCLFICLF